MALRPDSVMPHVNAAVLASQEGRLQEAIGYLREAWKAAPDHGAVNLNLGLALAESGDREGAVRHLRTAMKDPLCRAQAAFNCAVLVGGENPAEAVTLCRTALESEPGNARYAEALEYYRRAEKGRSSP
jgi:Flp pilus assembly protein TadD